MNKQIAIKLLGGSVASAAETIGVTYQAVNKWPEELPQRIVDRVFAAFVRNHPKNWQAIWTKITKEAA